MGQAAVIQEYLVKLGFQTDASSFKKMDAGLGVVGKRVLGVGLTAATAAFAVEKAAADFAYSMRSMYFASQISKSSVGNMMQMDFASKQIGISSDAMAGTLHNLGIQMRMPGMAEYVSGLTGINEEGRDTKDVLLDLVPAIQKASGGVEALGMQMAESVGIPGEQYLLLSENMGKLKVSAQEAADMQARFGIDAKQAAADSLEYAHQVDLLKLSFKTFEDSLISSVLPGLIKFQQGFTSVFGFIFRTTKKGIDFEQKLESTKLSDLTQDKVTNHPAVAATSPLTNPPTAPAPATTPLTNQTQPTAPEVMHKLQAMGWSKEASAGLAANFQKESNFDPQALGDRGQAYGIGQWHPDRQAEFKKWAGKDIRKSSLDEQIEFANYELTRGNEQVAGTALKGAKSSTEAGRIASSEYERPANRLGEANLRGMMAARLGGETINNNNVKVTANITVASTDPIKAGQEAGKAVHTAFSQSLRNQLQAAS